MKKGKILRSIFVVFTALALMACGGSGTKSDDDINDVDSNINGNVDNTGVIKRQLIDSPIAGVQYYCDGKEAQITTATGEFTCQNTPVTFQIGNLILGKISKFGYSNKIFPQDLVGVSYLDYNNSKLVNLIRILQSLDDDGNIETSINIPSERADSFGGDDVNEKSLSELAGLAGVELVSEEDAINHLTNSMIYVEKDIGQWGLNGMNLWMTACYYYVADNPTSDRYGITVVPISFTNGEASLGTSGVYMYKYSYLEGKKFQLKIKSDNSITIDAVGVGNEYYKDSISERNEIISLWATEGEAIDYQTKIAEHTNTQHRTCTLGSGFDMPGLFW